MDRTLVGRCWERPLAPKSSLKRQLRFAERSPIATVLDKAQIEEMAMNNVIYLVGLVVVVAFIASFVLGAI
jgi:hypothetical protein